MVLKTSVASMTSEDMITSLASKTSTASLASKIQKLLALYLLGDFPSIRNLSSLNDLSGLNGLNSLILSKHLLSMMLPLIWHQNDLSWSLNVEWIIKNPQFYGFLTIFLLEAVEAMDFTFNQIKGR